MMDNHLDDLAALIAVAEERSFTRAATMLGVSQSALSQTIRGLEARLGIRLLNRTTRTVSPTPAGERLLQTVSPRIKEIGAALAATSELRQKPAGLIRLTATENAAGGALAGDPQAAARISGHQVRGDHRFGADGYRCQASRCGRPVRRDRREGHDRGA